MGMEWEGEVEIEEDFGAYTWKMKLELIWEILTNGSWLFVGEDHIEIEPPDYP